MSNGRHEWKFCALTTLLSRAKLLCNRSRLRLTMIYSWVNHSHAGALICYGPLRGRVRCGPAAVARCVHCPLAGRKLEEVPIPSRKVLLPCSLAIAVLACPWPLSPSSEFGPLRSHDHPSQVPSDHDQLRTWDQFIRSPLILVDNGSLPESALRSVLVSSHGPLIPHRAHTIHHQWPRTTERIPTALMRP